MSFFRRTSVRIAGAFLVAAATTTAWTLLGPKLVPVLNEWLELFGPYASIGFVVLGALVIAVCAPASLLYITAGMIFGLGQGILLATAAAVLGSLLAFAASRTVFGERMARMFAQSARLDRFEHALSKRGLWLVTLLRLSLIAPIGPVSYALGVMRISVRTFLLAMPAVVPSIAVYVYAGHMAHGLMSEHGSREAWEWVVLGFGFAATALVTVWVGRAAQRAMSAPRATA